MKLNENTIGPVADRLARRWKLQLREQVAETRRAYVFKVDYAGGLAALKIYKRLGAGGEGAGIHFLRNLAPGIGVQIYRTSIVPSAVLMEWLEGETIDNMVGRGQDDEATMLAAQVARTIRQTRFRFPIIYKRVAPALQRDFKSCLSSSDSKPHHPELGRVIDLLAHLIETTRRETVIHGDLHFANIILTADGPRLIDPKGLRADPACECARTLVLPYGGTPLDAFERRIARRGPVLAEAVGTTPLRITQWAAVTLAHNVIIGAPKRGEKNNKAVYLTRLLDLAQF